MSLPSDGSDGDGATAADLMAETMGFASFGAQARPSKKRRMNDAFVGVDEDASPRGSAANSTPLGARKQPWPQHQQHADLPLHRHNQAAAPAAAVNADEIGLDLDGDGDGDDDDKEEGGAPATAAAAAVAAVPPAATAGLPPRPPGPTPGIHRHQHGRGGRAGGVGDRGASASSERQWWLDYYDPESNENPWEPLEKPLGLGPRGSWLARGHARP